MNWETIHASNLELSEKERLKVRPGTSIISVWQKVSALSLSSVLNT